MKNANNSLGTEAEALVAQMIKETPDPLEDILKTHKDTSDGDQSETQMDKRL